MSADIGKSIITADIDDWVHVSINKSISYVQRPSPQFIPTHLLQYNQYIIVIDEEKGIYKHSIYNKQYLWIKLTDIPGNIPFGDWSSYINQLTGDIYICIIQPWPDGELGISDEDFASVAVYNIPNNTWSINPNSWLQSTDCLEFKGPLSIQYIPSPQNKLHIIDTGTGSHSIYNHKSQSFKPIDDKLPFIKQWDNLIYVKTLKTLFVFGYNHQIIHYAKLPTPNQTYFRWKELTIKLPMKQLNVLLVFEKIIMFWSSDNDCKSIWFLDVDRNKLFKCDNILFDNFNIDTLISSEDSYLHGIDNSYHIKMDLYALLPPELINFYIDRIDKLITGFLKHMAVPSDLINLLRLFLPCPVN